MLGGMQCNASSFTSEPESTEGASVFGSDLDDSLLDAFQMPDDTGGDAVHPQFIDQSMRNLRCKEPKCYGQKNGDGCTLRVRRARSHAAKQSPEQKKACCQFVKIGGAHLLGAIDCFEKEAMCFGRGTRRAFWDLAQYVQKVTLNSSEVFDNSNLVWFTLHHYTWWRGVTQGWNEKKTSGEVQ